MHIVLIVHIVQSGNYCNVTTCDHLNRLLQALTLMFIVQYLLVCYYTKHQLVY